MMKTNVLTFKAAVVVITMDLIIIIIITTSIIFLLKLEDKTLQINVLILGTGTKMHNLIKWTKNRRSPGEH